MLTDSNIPRGLAPLPENRLQTLVENRQTFSLDHMELNIFETHCRAEKVPLKFNDLVLTSMLRGKKVMHLPNVSPFDYFPGESVIVQPETLMEIDFPEAQSGNPTQCIALAIDRDHIRQVLDYLNNKHPRVGLAEDWQVNPDMLHLNNSHEIAENISRLIKVSVEDHQAKDLFAGFALNELLVRLMQTQARALLFTCHKQLETTHRFAFLVSFIRQNLTRALTIEELSDKACMSQAHFFRAFKQELGLSPMEFVISERIKLAEQLLVETNQSITQVCFSCGFNNLHYFNRAFKKQTGTTPSAFRVNKSSSQMLG